MLIYTINRGVSTAQSKRNYPIADETGMGIYDYFSF